jgi:hypothetical protein
VATCPRPGWNRAPTPPEIGAQRRLSRHAFGAQFAEVGVDMDTGETRVLRLLGVFAAGRIVNPKTARWRGRSPHLIARLRPGRARLYKKEAQSSPPRG